MKSLSRVSVIAALLGALTVSAAGQARIQAPLNCDRACLTGLVDSYLTALVAHDAKRAAIAANAKFTEQTQVLLFTEGLWKNATQGPANFKIYVPDPVAGQVGFMGIMRELTSAAPPRGNAPAGAGTSVDRPIQLVLRLKVENKQITEAEHIIARLSENDMANFQAPNPALLATVPPAERLPRELMLLIGNSYYNSIVQSDGDAAPFAGDCARRENGRGTAGGSPAGTARGGAAPAAPGQRGAGPRMGCREQMNSRVFSYIKSIDLRRVWIADEEKGLVFGLTMFRHPYEERTRTIINPDGTRRTTEDKNNPFDLAAAHIFKIRGGKIHEIEAMGFSLPLNSKNGWSEFVR